MSNFDEGKILAQIENKAEKFYEQYKPQMDLLSKSPLIRIKESMSAFDVYALGAQLKAFDEYRQMVEADGSVGDLGRLPNVAYDVITVAFGSSIIPAVCSVQPIEDDAGVVFFKDLISNTTKGNITADDRLINPLGGQPKIPQNFSSNLASGEVIGTGNGILTSFTATLAGHPLRQSTLAITLTDSTTVYAKDDGNGVIIGRGVDGDIDYITGVLHLNFRTAPADTKTIKATYQVDVERASTIPSIRSIWRSRTVTAQIFALQGSIGLLQAYGARKKFGSVMDDELASDLVTEINAETGANLVLKLVANAQGNTNWSQIRSDQISEMEHRAGFQYIITDAEAVLVQNAGRGLISGIIGGTDFCRYIANQPQFSRQQDVSTIGPSIFGTYNGMTIIRVADSTILDPAVGIGYYKGPSPFEGPAVFAPYMPLTVTSTLPGASNPLQNRKAAAVWAAIDILVDNYVTKMTITKTPPHDDSGIWPNTTGQPG